MEAAGEERGVGVEFFGATDPNRPPAEQQIAHIEQAVADGIDGIGVTAGDAALLLPSLEEAEAAGLRIIAFNTPPTPEDEAMFDLPFSTYVGMIETVAAGQTGLHARDLIEADGGTMDVVLCIKGMNAASWAVQRCEGITDELTPLGVTVTTLGGDFYADPPDIPMSMFVDWFAANPDVDFVYSTAPAVLNMLLSMRAAGTIPATVMLGSVDLDSTTLDAIRAGTCEFSVDQQPYLQGYLSIALLDLEANYLLRLSDAVQTGPFFVDVTNVEEIAGLIETGYR